MLTEQTIIQIDNIDTSLKTLSIHKILIILRDGVEISRGNPHSCAFYPGQIAEVKAFTGWDDTSPEIIYLKSIWNQEIIDAYLDMISAQQQNPINLS